MMALAGLSYASIVVSSFSRAQNRVLQMGFADDMNTYVMISGMFRKIDTILMIYFTNPFSTFMLMLFISCYRNLVICLFFGKFCRTYDCWSYS